MSQWAVIAGVCGVIGITLSLNNMTMLVFVHGLSPLTIKIFFLFLLIPAILAIASLICSKLGSMELKQTRGVSGRSMINVGLVTSSLTLFFTLMNVLCCLFQMTN